MPTEIQNLQAKLRARENRPGFKVNVEEIKARIAELEGGPAPTPTPTPTPPDDDLPDVIDLGEFH